MMSFHDVAVEVLRSVGRPLHYKKITEIAIRRGLLSDVGKTPGLTMGSQLSQEARQDEESVVVRTRPGVFALREWAPEGGEVEAAPVLSEDEGFEDEVEAPPVVAAADDPGDEEGEDEGASGRPPLGRRGRRSRRRGGRSLDVRAPAVDEIAPAAEPVRVRTRRQPVAEVAVEPEEAVSASLKGQEKMSVEAGALIEVVVDEVTAGVHGVAPGALTSADEARAQSGKRSISAGSSHGASGLMEGGLSDEAVNQEAELSQIARNLKGQARERLTAALPKMSRAGLEHLSWSLMERMSGAEPTAGLRLDGGDLLILTGAVGFDEGRVGLLVRFNDAELSAAGVGAVREALGELGVQSGAVVAVGGASADASAAAAEAVVGVKLNILDARTLAGQLVRHGVGVLSFEVPVVMTDLALLGDLGER